MLIIHTDQGAIDAQPLVVVTVGGAGGPRIVTSTFDMKLYFGQQRSSGQAKLSADLDAALWQDEFAIRRRAARSVILVGKQTAAGILAGSVHPTLQRRPPPDTRATITFFGVLNLDGFERRARVQLDFRCDPGDDEPDVRDLVKRAGNGLKTLAERLHSAIDDPANLFIFGTV